MNLSEVFLNCLGAKLDEFSPSIVKVLDSQDGAQCHDEIVLEGLMRIDPSSPRVRITIQYQQDMWISRLPSVRVIEGVCLSPFFNGQDSNMNNWHRYKDGRLCWIYPQTWREIVCAPMIGERDAERAALQLIKNVTVLLKYHLEAYRRRYLHWRKCWDFQPHGG